MQERIQSAEEARVAGIDLLHKEIARKQLKQRVNICMKACSSRFKALEKDYNRSMSELKLLRRAVSSEELLYQEAKDEDVERYFRYEIEEKPIDLSAALGVSWSSSITYIRADDSSKEIRETLPASLRESEFTVNQGKLDEIMSRFELQERAIERNTACIRQQEVRLSRSILLIAHKNADLKAALATDTEILLLMLISALRTHQVSESLIDTFEKLLTVKARKEHLKKDIIHTCSNLIDVLSIEPSVSTHNSSEAVIRKLIREKLSQATCKEWRSLFHVLAREEKLPYDLESLACHRNFELPAKVAVVRQKHCQIFDCDAKTWSPKIKYLSLYPSLGTHHQSCIFLPNGNLFVCGGDNPLADDTFEINLTTGAVHPLASMPWKVCANGLAVYFNWIYSFGAYVAGYLNYSAKYSITANKWASLKNSMHVSRCCTNPCLYQHIIYLMGGCSTTCELFNPATETFTLLSLTLPAATHTRVYIFEDDIVAIQPSKIVKISLNSMSNPRVETNSTGQVCGCMSGCVADGKVWYFGCYWLFHSIDAQSGNHLSTIKEPSE